MSKKMGAFVSIALVLLFLGSNLAWGLIRLQPGPGPTPEFDGGGSDTDPDDFPLEAGDQPTAELDALTRGDLSAKSILRIFFLAAGVVPR